MKFRYIVLVLIVAILGYGYYVGNKINKEVAVKSAASKNLVKIEDASIKSSTYTPNKAQVQELASASALMSEGVYPVQAGVTSASGVNDNGVIVPNGAYGYNVNGSELGLAQRPYKIYAVSGKGSLKVTNTLQRKPSDFNISNIISPVKTFNIIGEINGYYYVSYSENGSSNINYAFAKASDVALKGNLVATGYSYNTNLTLSKLRSANDFKYSGLNIYSNPYLLSSPEVILNYKSLENFYPIVLTSMHDATEIYYSGNIGWISSGNLESI